LRAGHAALAAGDLKHSADVAVRALERCPWLYAAHELLARSVLPGDSYLALLEHLHAETRPESYIEIGVQSGKSLALVQPGTSALGIDPNHQISATRTLRAKLFAATSDRFFETHDALEELETKRLALAFIDGLHEFEQVLRDFINLERLADAGTVILIHDCLPVSRLVAARNRVTRFWCGDVWKIVPCLRQFRPDLRVDVAPAFPSGLAVVSGLDPSSTVLEQNYAEAVAEFVEAPVAYEYLTAEIVTREARASRATIVNVLRDRQAAARA
jgi:predicted O-methyltransferase YrrM